jgi:hypothetical protein
LMTNLSGCSLARALPVTLMFRSPSILALAVMPSIRGIAWHGAFAQQRHGQDRTVDDELGDFRMARPQARELDVGLDAADGQAIAGVAVLRILQRDVVQRHIQRRPDADFGRARYGQPVSGLALDPRLDAGGQETGGNPDDQHEPGDHDDGGDGGPGDFQCSHDGIPTRANNVDSGCAIPDVADGLSLSRKGQTAQRSPKIIQGCCKVM